MKPYLMSAYKLGEAYRAGSLTPTGMVESLLERIEAVDAQVGAYADVNGEAALARARALESAPPTGRLWGVPVAVKDNICIEGELTRCGSAILEGFRPPYHATVTELLLEEGAILLGRTNMDEFAFGSSTETSVYRDTRNPWDLSRVPGGSSGGSAAAVSACEAMLALGSETGGSIRQPAALCGVVGLKPTYGRVSRYGLVAFASSLDQIGPLARDVRDVALLTDVIGRHDPRDSTSADVAPAQCLEALEQGVAGLRLGLPAEFFVDGMEPEVRQRVEEAVDVLTGAGATIVEVSLPHTRFGIADYYILATAEASSNLSRFDGVQYGLREPFGDLWSDESPMLRLYGNTRSRGFGDEVKRRLILGTYVLSSGYYDAYYLRAQKVRTLIQRDFDSVFEQCDCLVTPTAPTTAFRVGERMADPIQMYLSDICTVTANLAGVPALTVPCGFDHNKLPVGLQFIAPVFGEPMLCRVGHTYQQLTDFHQRSTPLVNGEGVS